MSLEIQPGAHIVCQNCPARTGRTPADYGCNTSLLDGIRTKQPFMCPLPRVNYSAVSAPRANPHQLLRQQLRK